GILVRRSIARSSPASSRPRPAVQLRGPSVSEGPVSWNGLDGRSDEPILGNICGKHIGTTLLALLGAAIDDELPRSALRMADCEGDGKTLWKGHDARFRSRLRPPPIAGARDRKSTRLNSSH